MTYMFPTEHPYLRSLSEVEAERERERTEMERHEYQPCTAAGTEGHDPMSHCVYREGGKVCYVPSSAGIHFRVCPGFSVNDTDYCEGDEPDAGQRYCQTCRWWAASVRTDAEDEKERSEEQGYRTKETYAEYLRVMALCEEVLGR